MKVLVADGSRPLRSALKGLFDCTPGLDVLTAASAGEAIACCERERPEAAVLALGLPGGSTLDVLAQARRAVPGMLLIVLAQDAADAGREACFELGADHFLDKHSGFYEAVRLVLDHEKGSGPFFQPLAAAKGS